MRTSAAEHLVRQHIRVLDRALPAARDGNVTSLHEARVATRRLRAALPLLGPGKKAERLGRAVRRLTRTLGPVRELDVALLILDELEKSGEVPVSAIQLLRQTVEQERQSLHSELRSRLERFDIGKFRKRAVTAVRKQDARRSDRAKKPHPRTANAPAQRRAERLTFAIDNAAGLYLPDRLHEVRIAVKKLRYALELAQSVGGSRAPGRLRTLKSAQDLLGRMHDLEVLIARTRSIQSSPGRSSLKTSADLDRLVRRLENECRQLHGQYMNVRRRLVALSSQLTSPQPRNRARHSAA